MPSSLKLTQRQKELLTGIVIVAGLFGGLGGAEALLRVNQLMTFGTLRTIEKSNRYYVDETTGLRLPVPNSVHGKIEFNTLGFRGPEIEQPKPQGVIRIAFMGHSTTFDPYNLSVETTWPHLTIQKLQEGIPGCRVDYVNAAVPGFSTGRILTYFKHFVAKVTPDIVVILANDQDHDLDDVAQEQGIHDGIHYQPSWLAKQSLFWSKVEKNAVIMKRRRAAFSDVNKLNDQPDDLTSGFQRNLTELTTLVRSSGAWPVLITISGQLRSEQKAAQQLQAAGSSIFFLPFMSIDGLLSARETYNRAVVETAEATDAFLVDIRDKIPGDAEHYADSGHYTAAGSAVMSEIVSRSLEQSTAFRQLIGERNPACLQ